MGEDKIRKEKIQLLKKHLPHGSIKRISKELGLIELSVSKVLDGKWNNERVLAAALKIAEEQQKSIKALIRYFKKKK